MLVYNEVMATAVLYLSQSFIFRIWQFFVHWYGHGYLNIGGAALNTLEQMDKTLALRITLRYFGQPLYKDYTYLGYALGLVFRSLRILIGVVVYAVVVAVFAAIYLSWAAVPVYLVLKMVA